MPITPFIGVRISWLMLARNSLFAWLATCAICASVCQPLVARLQLARALAQAALRRHQPVVFEQ